MIFVGVYFFCHSAYFNAKNPFYCSDLINILYLIISIMLFLSPLRGCGHVGNQCAYGAVGMVLATSVQTVGSLLSNACALVVNGISAAECWLSICPQAISQS